MFVESKYFLFLNVAFFYVYWWACFFGAANNSYYYGPILVLLYFIIHFYFIRNKFLELKYILFCIILGLLVETLMLRLNFISYNGIFSENFSIAPMWIILLWGGLGSTIFHSFRWMLERFYLAFFLGGLVTPFFYFSAEKIGAISINQSFFNGYFILAIVWSFSLLLLIYIAGKMENKYL